MSTSSPRHWQTVSVDVDDKTHVGKWEVDCGMLIVRTTNGEEETQVGGTPPESLAKQLLRQMVREGRA